MAYFGQWVCVLFCYFGHIRETESNMRFWVGFSFLYLEFFFFPRKTVFWPLNAMFTIFLHQILHQILSGGLLLVTMGEQKSYLCCRFKLESITTYDL